MSISRILGCCWMACLCGIAPVGAAQSREGVAQKPGAVASETAKDKPANPQAVALVEFKKRVDGYVAMQKKVVQSLPPMKETADPAEITRAQEALETSLRGARADARPGDIFTPEISAVLRRILAPELKGVGGKDAKAIIKDDAPTSVPLKVNAKYPAGATLPTVPAAVLANLPTLPAELEYRIVQKHLILIDTKASMIVDFIPNAIA